MVKETKRDLDTVSELELQQKEIADRIRAKKKIDAEIRLQEQVNLMDTSDENIDNIISACYNYIATHRKR